MGVPLRSPHESATPRKVEKLCKHNNLLFRSLPTGGDYSILSSENLDKKSFCKAIFDLLHGPDDSPARLERYLAHVRRQALPNRWVFPTYLLFFSNPGEDYVVKPSVTRWFLELLGAKDLYSSDPSGEIYAAILDVVHELRTELKPYGVRLIALLDRVNREIGNPHYQVGITFFLQKDLGRHLEDIWRMEISPYLEEYFFHQPEKAESFRWDQVRQDLGA